MIESLHTLSHTTHYLSDSEVRSSELVLTHHHLSTSPLHTNFPKHLPMAKDPSFQRWIVADRSMEIAKSDYLRVLLKSHYDNSVVLIGVWRC